jgi:hypothetical protein
MDDELKDKLLSPQQSAQPDAAESADSADFARTPDDATGMHEVLEQVEKDAASQAALQVLREHTARVRELQDKYMLSNHQILSPDLSVGANLPREVREYIGDISTRLRTIIRAVAERIESRKYEPYLADIERFDLTALERDKAHTLINAEKHVNVSLQSLKATVDFFSRINKDILHELEESRSRTDTRSEKRLILENTILIYELADFVVTFLDTFQVEGTDEISRLHQSMLEQIEKNRTDLQQLKRAARSKKLDPKVSQQGLATIEAREESLKLIKQEWDTYLKRIKEVQAGVATVEKQVPTLKFIRDNARNQLDFLEIVMVAEIIKNNIDAVEAVALTLGDMELTSLPPDSVRRLLGIAKT